MHIFLHTKTFRVQTCHYSTVLCQTWMLRRDLDKAMPALNSAIEVNRTVMCSCLGRNLVVLMMLMWCGSERSKTNHSDTVQIWDRFIASHFHLHLGQVSQTLFFELNYCSTTWRNCPSGVHVDTTNQCVRHWVSCPRVTLWKSKPWESLQEALWMTFSEVSGRFTSSYKSSVHRAQCIARDVCTILQYVERMEL